MIAIVNISKTYSKKRIQLYALKINSNTVVEFQHHPIDGLAACLEKAAKMVREKKMDGLDLAIIQELLGKKK